MPVVNERRGHIHNNRAREPLTFSHGEELRSRNSATLG